MRFVIIRLIRKVPRARCLQCDQGPLYGTHLITFCWPSHTCAIPLAPQWAAADAATVDGLTSQPNWLDFIPPEQPEPIRFPRRALDQRFAVLLMQSSYRAVDALDFIPMVWHPKPFFCDIKTMTFSPLHKLSLF